MGRENLYEKQCIQSTFILETPNSIRTVSTLLNLIDVPFHDTCHDFPFLRGAVSRIGAAAAVKNIENDATSLSASLSIEPFKIPVTHVKSLSPSIHSKEQLNFLCCVLVIPRVSVQYTPIDC